MGGHIRSDNVIQDFPLCLGPICKKVGTPRRRDLHHKLWIRTLNRNSNRIFQNKRVWRTGPNLTPSSMWVVISLVKIVNSKTVNRLCLQFSLTTQSASQVWIHSFTNISWADGCGDLTGGHLPIRGTPTSDLVLSDVFLLVYLLNFKILCHSGHQWKWMVTWLLFSFNHVTALSFHEVLKWKSSKGVFLWHFEPFLHRFSSS